MPRPERLVVVTGTATEVGKTFVSAAWLSALVSCAARKPVQSFSATDEGPTDAEVLAAATGETPHDVCPPHRWYELPMAPPMAAAALGRPPFTTADLVAELEWPSPQVEVGLVETAGGVRSPISDDGDNVHLVRALAPDAVFLVADAGLGTINAVRLCTAALGDHAPVTVFLNRFDDGNDLHCRNRDWLAERDRLQVVTTVAAL